MSPLAIPPLDDASAHYLHRKLREGVASGDLAVYNNALAKYGVSSGQKGALRRAFNKKGHGNQLTNAPAEGYTLRDKRTREIVKYGETSDAGARYSKKYLRDNNLVYVKELDGTKIDMHRWQNNQILDYKQSRGVRPPFNHSDY